MFRRLDYQDRVLAALDSHIDLLKANKHETDEIAALAATKPHLDIPVPDFAENAWNALKAESKLPLSRCDVPYSARKDGCDRPVPNVVLKVPTGGAKTWLAVSGVSRIMGRYLQRNTGFVLWIVPNEAIYSQTLQHLKDRQHPYRQALDRVAAGRVKVMEKADLLDARDVEANLCVMLLMLQSANRETKDTLKMFQDRGDVHGFFPPEGDQEAHREALHDTANLDAYRGMFPMVKDSLGNALRMIRPVVVLDEGHKAISDLAFRTLYGFNPCFVLELTATPRDVKERYGKNAGPARYANLLVEVTGREIDREGMIKIPLNLDTRQGTDWRATLYAAVSRLDRLDAAARTLRAETDRYLRPIMLVQVERTGTDQRESGRIHAEDVREALLGAGFDDAEIAVKTAETNDLAQPENQDLLSSTNRVRAIITKQALQEGWDCPFAYLLCSLAASTNLNAMTQLVGRILRQPHASKTGVGELDECHIITHHAETAEVVAAIKAGLERDGLGDLVLAVDRHDTGDAPSLRKLARRARFAKKEIYLPRVMVKDGTDLREIDYETDILSRIDWRGFDPRPIAERVPVDAQFAETQFQRIAITGGDDPFTGESVSGASEALRFDASYAVRAILDIVPNPFVGREIVGSLLHALREGGFDASQLGRLAGLIVEELRKALQTERDVRAEAVFKTDATDGRIQFHLRLDGNDWHMPFHMDTTAPENAPLVASKTGGPLGKSLFVPVYQQDLNSDEREVAVYLDAEKTLKWWHRNVARAQYGIQGWQSRRIYPDFVFAMGSDGHPERITVLETKGDHLDNINTDYKRDLLDFLSRGRWRRSLEVRDGIDVGSVELPTFQFALVLMRDWKAELPNLIAGGSERSAGRHLAGEGDNEGPSAETPA
ncbi:MAG: DEAD/DEAH box helicase family protein [Gammaproteobacteria bacterium]|nr:DEAD/DEAH box helicase family protein [Gammaproteobacteria bacterium]